jgi:HK97 family phage portal protein
MAKTATAGFTPVADRRPGSFKPRVTRITPKAPRGTVQLVPDAQLTMQFSDPMGSPRRMVRLYSNVNSVFVAVRRIANDVASLTPRLRTGPEDEAKEVTGGPLNDIFLRPNPIHSWGQTMRAFVSYLLTAGRGHLLMTGGTPAAPTLGAPFRNLWILPAHSIKVVAQVPAGIAGYEFKVDGLADPVLLPVVNVASAMEIDLMNPYTEGQSPFRAALLEVEQDLNANRFNASFLRRGGSPSAIVTPKDGTLSPEERSKLEHDIRERWIGPDNAGGVLLLEDVDVTPFQYSHRDMAFQTMKQAMQRAIFSAGNVNPGMVGDYEGSTGLGAGAQVNQQERTHWKNSVKPVLSMIEYMVNSQIVPILQPGTYFSFDLSGVDALQDGEDAIVDRSSKRISFGLATPNDILREQGMPTYPEGDTHFIASNLQPIAGPLKEQSDKRAKDMQDAMINGSTENDEDEPAPGEEDTDGSTAPPPPPQDKAARALELGRKMRRENIASSFHQKVVPFAAVLERIWRVNLADLHDDIVANLRKADTTGIGADSKLVNQNTPMGMLIPMEEEILRRVMQRHGPAYKKIMGAFGRDSVREFGGPTALFDEGAPGVLRLIQRNKEQVGQRVKTLLDRCRKTLEQGINAREDVSALASRIRTIVAGDPDTSLRGGPTARSLAIAENEALGAASQGRAEAMKQLGVEYNGWATSGDERVRETHEAQDGYIVPTGKEFPNGCKYPHDPDGDPGETINCRCVLYAATKEDME